MVQLGVPCIFPCKGLACKSASLQYATVKTQILPLAPLLLRCTVYIMRVDLAPSAFSPSKFSGNHFCNRMPSILFSLSSFLFSVPVCTLLPILDSCHLFLLCSQSGCNPGICWYILYHGYFCVLSLFSHVLPQPDFTRSQFYPVL